MSRSRACNKGKEDQCHGKGKTKAKQLDCLCPPCLSTKEHLECVRGAKLITPKRSLSRSKSPTPPPNHTLNYLNLSTGSNIKGGRRTRRHNKKTKRVRSMWKWW